MSEVDASYKNLLRSTGIVGGASLAVLIIGLVRAKAFALLLGPAGIGLLGLLSALIAAAAAIGGMGLNMSAVRQLAEDGADPRTVRAGIWSLTWLLAPGAGLIVWLLRQPLSVAITGTAEMSAAIGWSALAVFLTVIAATQTAVFQGLRRLGAMARTNTAGALIGTLLSIAAVYIWREKGIVAAVIIIPFCIAAVGSLLMRTFPADGDRPGFNRSVATWRPMLHLGAGVVITAVIGTVAQLALRSIVLRNLGIEGVGLFQAALTIATINVGLVLTAMSADFFPRLSRVSDQPAELSKLLEQQMHVAIVLSAPILIALAAGAPLWLRVLYSNEFTGAADLLRVQVMSEILRLPGWGLGYVLLARGDRSGYILNELAFTVGAVGMTLLLVPWLGLIGAGVGYALGYAVAIAISATRTRRRHHVRLDRSILRQLSGLLGACGLLLLIGMRVPMVALVLGTALTILAGWWALAELQRRGALPSGVPGFVSRLPRR